MFRLIARSALAAALSFGAFSANAQVTPDPMQQHNSNAVWFENWVGLSNATLVVAAPNGKISQVQASSGTPVYQLEGGAVQDGVYRYELRAATEEMVEIVNPVPTGRGEAESPTHRPKPFYRTGFFVVDRGVIITPEFEEEEG